MVISELWGSRESSPFATLALHSHQRYSCPMSPTQKKFLFTLLSRPTAPFREQLIAGQAIDFLTHNNIAHFTDPVGNIVIGVGSAAAYKRLLKEKEQEPVRLFMAHMDHPGFHGQRWLSDKGFLRGLCEILILCNR